MTKVHMYSAAGILLLGIIVWASWPTKRTLAPTTNIANNLNAGLTNVPSDIDQPVNASTDTIVFSTADLPDRDPAFSFTALLPKTWRVEYVASSSAINIYDPQATGRTSLEQSKIFIKYFQASSFLTLTTVDIISQTDLIIQGRPAKSYIVKKKPGIALFSSQPAWRNFEHRVTDIRTTDTNPTTFYVVAQSPDLSDTLFDIFLTSMTFLTPGAE